MRRVAIFAVLLFLLVPTVSAMEFTAPEVPESGRAWMPYEAETFSQGLAEILRNAIGLLQPDLAKAASVCMGTLACVMIVSILQNFTGITKNTSELVGTVTVACLLMNSTSTLIHLGAQTVHQLSEYGKLLLPVMAAAMGAQGMAATSAALYAGTAAFDAVLSGFIAKILTPMIYLFLALSVTGSAVGEETMKKLREMIRGFLVWCMKTLLYIFTGYMGITGVVTGSTDAAALKAAKLTISSAVPVVGGILSDASEAVLVGAGLMKNAAGIYGMLAILSVCLEPFVRIGAQYLLLKLTAGLCAMFGPKRLTDMLADFSSALGLLLAMTGTCCLLLIISIVCFMKGAGI